MQKLTNKWFNTIVLCLYSFSLFFIWIKVVRFEVGYKMHYKNIWIFGFLSFYSLSYLLCLSYLKFKVFRWYHTFIFFGLWFCIFIFFAGLYWSYIDNVQLIYNPTLKNIILKILDEIIRIFELGISILFINIPLNILMLVVPFFLVNIYYKSNSVSSEN